MVLPTLPPKDPRRQALKKRKLLIDKAPHQTYERLACLHLQDAHFGKRKASARLLIYLDQTRTASQASQTQSHSKLYDLNP